MFYKKLLFLVVFSGFTHLIFCMEEENPTKLLTPDENIQIDTVSEEDYCAVHYGPETAADYLDNFITKLNIVNCKKYSWRTKETTLETALDLFSNWHRFTHLNKVEFLKPLASIIEKYLKSENFNPIEINKLFKFFINKIEFTNSKEIHRTDKTEYINKILAADEQLMKLLITLNEKELFDANINLEIESISLSNYDSSKKTLKYETLIHRAAAKDRADWVEFLIDQLEANINQKNSEGETALLVAFKNQAWSVIHKLLEYEQIDVNAQDNAFKNLLYLAIESENFELIQLLLDEGAQLPKKTVPTPKQTSIDKDIKQINFKATEEPHTSSSTTYNSNQRQRQIPSSTKPASKSWLNSWF